MGIPVSIEKRFFWGTIADTQELTVTKEELTIDNTNFGLGVTDKLTPQTLKSIDF